MLAWGGSALKACGKLATAAAARHRAASPATIGASVSTTKLPNSAAESNRKPFGTGSLISDKANLNASIVRWPAARAVR